jgi:predicted Zn-dependent protease
MTRIRLVSIVCLALLAIAGGASAHTRLEPGFNFFTAQQDVQIGTQAAANLERQIPVLSTPATARLVERVGRRLVANASGPQFPYRFRVVNLSDVNAFALPGGSIYVHRGLIERVQSEDELAAVMAHEIGHVVLRHPTQQVSRAYVAQTGAGLIANLLGGGHSSRSSQILNTIGGIGLNVMFLKYSRSAEEEADAIGARIMARAGYDPEEMANFFALLRRQNGSDPSRVAVFLSSHPAAASREAHIRGEARQMSFTPRPSVGGLWEAQAELRRLPPAPKMSQVVRPQSSTGALED